jgi:hypothetical protein
MERQLAVVCVCVMLTTVVNAQGYNKFKLGLGAGYAGGNGGFSFSGGGGALLTLEPAYRLNDGLAIGVRFEGAAYGTGSAIGFPEAFGSITLSGQYYMGAEEFRPFVGAGVGYFSHNKGRWGLFPRIGFDSGHWTLALEFNLVPAGSSSYDYLTNTSATSSAYYLGIRIGGFFFGGKREQEP